MAYLCVECTVHIIRFKFNYHLNLDEIMGGDSRGWLTILLHKQHNITTAANKLFYQACHQTVQWHY